MHGDFENFNRKAVIAAYYKAVRSGVGFAVADIRAANPDLATRFDLIDAEQDFSEGGRV